MSDYEKKFPEDPNPALTVEAEETAEGTAFRATTDGSPVPGLDDIVNKPGAGSTHTFSVPPNNGTRREYEAALLALTNGALQAFWEGCEQNGIKHHLAAQTLLSVLIMTFHQNNAMPAAMEIIRLMTSTAPTPEGALTMGMAPGKPFGTKAN